MSVLFVLSRNERFLPAIGKLNFLTILCVSIGVSLPNGWREGGEVRLLSLLNKKASKKQEAGINT